MTTENLIPDLIAYEGLRLKPYRDTLGNWTIGVGHLIRRNEILFGSPVVPGFTLTQSQCLQLLDTDIQNVEYDLDHYLPWWRKLSDIRQDVMVNLAFNLGVVKLSTWKHTLGDIQSGNFKAAQIDLDNDEPWASQVHRRAYNLALQMETDQHVAP